VKAKFRQLRNEIQGKLEHGFYGEEGDARSGPLRYIEGHTLAQIIDQLRTLRDQEGAELISDSDAYATRTGLKPFRAAGCR
jgi:hypothetical protein